MKNLLLIFVTLISFTCANAQKDTSKTLKFTGAEICSGKGAVTSGLYGYANFESNKSLLMITLSNNDNEVTYLRKFKKVFAGVNGGYFFNVPYAGPQMVFLPSKYFSTFHWLGYSIGIPEGKLDRGTFLFAVNQANVYVGNFNASYTLIHYMFNQPQHIGAIKYTAKINKSFSGYTEVGYDFTKSDQLLKLGIIYKK